MNDEVRDSVRARLIGKPEENIEQMNQMNRGTDEQGIMNDEVGSGMV
jgi:hypothetical protein